MERPENELGVLALFAQQCQKDGWEIVSVQVGFPDLVIREEATGKEYRAELEYAASNFKAHRHDPRLCDLVICWKNDWLESPMTIWTLADKQNRQIRLLTEEQKEILYLRLENEALTGELKTMRTELRNLEQEKRNAKSITGGGGRYVCICGWASDNQRQFAGHRRACPSAIKERTKESLVTRS